MPPRSYSNQDRKHIPTTTSNKVLYKQGATTCKTRQNSNRKVKQVHYNKKKYYQGYKATTTQNPRRKVMLRLLTAIYDCYIIKNTKGIKRHENVKKGK